jgi:hypothetical protein
MYRAASCQNTEAMLPNDTGSIFMISGGTISLLSEIGVCHDLIVQTETRSNARASVVGGVYNLYSLDITG